MNSEKHIPVPKHTPACICADCGAVSLSPNGICKMQGKGTKADWCGSKAVAKPKFCQQEAHTTRYRCQNCGHISVNAELLCEPELLS